MSVAERLRNQQIKTTSAARAIVRRELFLELSEQKKFDAFFKGLEMQLQKLPNKTAEVADAFEIIAKAINN
ncbi:MAG: hypothetical protein ACRC2T_11620 [Thermoguttaceae bacterium]